MPSLFRQTTMSTNDYALTFQKCAKNVLIELINNYESLSCESNLHEKLITMQITAIETILLHVRQCISHMTYQSELSSDATDNTTESYYYDSSLYDKKDDTFAPTTEVIKQLINSVNSNIFMLLLPSMQISTFLILQTQLKEQINQLKKLPVTQPINFSDGDLGSIGKGIFIRTLRQ